jgi:hypothetical protein
VSSQARPAAKQQRNNSETARKQQRNSKETTGKQQQIVLLFVSDCRSIWSGLISSYEIPNGQLE